VDPTGKTYARSAGGIAEASTHPGGDISGIPAHPIGDPKKSPTHPTANTPKSPTHPTSDTPKTPTHPTANTPKTPTHPTANTPTHPTGDLVETFAGLAVRIRAEPPRCGPVRLIAIDGPGGAGKSTFARRLASALGGMQIIHTDDFASWENPLNWWPRLEDQVLGPLEAGNPGRFQRYDWDRRELAEWHDVPVTDVIVEGVSSARLAVADRLSWAVWIATRPAVRLHRGLERDGDEALQLWRTGMAEEDRHFTQDRTMERADVVVDGNPMTPHDPDVSFIRLR
jgi:hypothetical protein